MANYSLIIDSTFQPFSFERYIQPYQIYDQAYREVEDNLSDLEMEAGQWDKLANAQTDPKTHATYKKYAKDLRKQADALAKYGLNPQSRRGMLDMRRRFSSEITPIVKAYERRRQLADEQRQRNSDGTLRFSTDFSKLSLDAMVDNPELSYTTVSGHEVMDRASKMFSRLAQVIDKEPSVSKREDLKGYLQILRQSGYDPAVALEDYGAEMPPEIKRVYDNIDESFANEPAYDKEWGHSWIGQAAYDAIGTKAYEIMDDKMVMSAAQAAADRREGQRIAEQTRSNKASEAIAMYNAKENKRHNQAMEGLQRQQLQQSQPTSAIGPDGRYTPQFVSSLTAGGNSYMINGDGSITGAKGARAWYGKGLGTGTNNYAVSSGSDFSHGDQDPYNVDFNNNKSHIVMQARRHVAEYFGLSTNESYLKRNDSAAAQIAQLLYVYRDQDYIGNNEFMICMPGIDPLTGRPDAKMNADYLQFLGTANSIISLETRAQ